MSRLNRPLLSLGIGPAPQHLLCISGRTSGIARVTPVAVLELGGSRYIVAGYAGAAWVRNARRAGQAELRRGRIAERVLMDEVPVAERAPILREFAHRVRGGRAFLTVAASASDEDFVKASSRHPVFRVRPESAAVGP
jgi:hypothetical protein